MRIESQLKCAPRAWKQALTRVTALRASQDVCMCHAMQLSLIDRTPTELREIARPCGIHC
eukprot:6542896-Pyramimonas_sp.AAC.1